MYLAQIRARLDPVGGNFHTTGHLDHDAAKKYHILLRAGQFGRCCGEFDELTFVALNNDGDFSCPKTAC